MDPKKTPTPSYWIEKFRNALRGTWQEIREDRSYLVHFSFAAAVLVCAGLFGVSLVEWCILILCITVVVAAETFNGALEWMAKAVTDDYDPKIRRALDAGSAAVLLASIGASIIGAIIFVTRLGELAGWWS